MLLIALALVCSALLGYLFAARTGTDAAADTLGQRLAIGGVVLIVVGHRDPDALHDRGRERGRQRGRSATASRSCGSSSSPPSAPGC